MSFSLYKKLSFSIFYLLVGFFSLMFYNQLVFLPEISAMNSLLIVASLPKKNLETKKAFDFIKLLESKLEKIQQIKVDSEVCYFDLKTGIYKVFDQASFNEVLNKTYFDEIVLPEINYNDFYFRLNLCLSNTFRDSNYIFYKNIFNNYHFLSWFFKSLRKSEFKHNVFDLNLFLDNFPKAYLSYVDSDTEINYDKHIDFVLKYIHELQNYGILIVHSGNKISFDLEHNIKKSQELINFSFESLVFGYNKEYFNKKVDSCVDIDFFVKNDNGKKVKDYVFNYLVASLTNYVTYDNYSNNLYLDFDIEK